MANSQYSINHTFLPLACLNLAAFAAATLVASFEGPTPRALMLLVLVSFATQSALFGYLLKRPDAEPEPKPAQPDPRFDRLIGILERVATALESGATIGNSADTASSSRNPVAEIRIALADRAWERVEAALAELADHPDRDRLHREVEAAKGSAREDLTARLQSARDVNDADRVLEIHSQLAYVITPEEFRAVNAELASWFLKLIMRRMTSGTVRPDVADLAARVAERFPATKEGAGLHASLPTLRRSAGLCPKCGKPYAGLDDACPSCLVGTFTPAPEEEEDPTESVRRDDELSFD